MSLPEADVQQKLHRLLERHRAEWSAFVHALGERSFIAKWAVNGTV